MKNNQIILHQTLHGYSNGHHMLSSSIRLSAASKKLMDKLSDRSGAETIPGFEGYFSGYYLENEQLLVISRTWSAFEMSRPGCVWTHSILFDVKYAEILSKNISDIVKLFRRPLDGIEIDEYSRKIEYVVDTYSFYSWEIHFDTDKLQYLTWIILGCAPPVAVLVNDSEEYVRELLLVWLTCYNELSQKYSFVTAVTSVRREALKLMSLQFIPNSYRNKAIPSTEKIEVVKSIDTIQKYPAWVIFACDLIKRNKWGQFKKFRQYFGQEYNDTSYLTAFIKLFAMLSELENSSEDFELFKLIEILFDGESRTNIGNVIIRLCMEEDTLDHFCYLSPCSVIRATLEYSWLSISTDLLSEYIRSGFEQDPISSQAIVKHLAQIDDEHKQELYLNQYAFLITATTLEEFSGMDLGICSVLVSINPLLSNCVNLWKQGEGYQKRILDAIKHTRNSNSLSIQIAYTILDTSIYNHALDISSIWKNAATTVFLDYLMNDRHLPSNSRNGMLELCKKSSVPACELFNSRQTALSKKQLFTLFQIINPFSDKIHKESLVTAFRSLDLIELSQKERNSVADFCFPVILRDESQYPKKMVSFASTNVHERLAKLSYPDNEWEKLQKLLPEISWFSMWDRCKRVRKAMKNKGYKDSIFNDYKGEYIYSRNTND